MIGFVSTISWAMAKLKTVCSSARRRFAPIGAPRQGHGLDKFARITAVDLASGPVAPVRQDFPAEDARIILPGALPGS